MIDDLGPPQDARSWRVLWSVCNGASARSCRPASRSELLLDLIIDIRIFFAARRGGFVHVLHVLFIVLIATHLAAAGLFLLTGTCRAARLSHSARAAA